MLSRPRYPSHSSAIWRALVLAFAAAAAAAPSAAAGELQVTDRVVGAGLVRPIDDVSGDGKPDYALETAGSVKVLFGTRNLPVDLAAIAALRAGGPASLEIRSATADPVRLAGRSRATTRFDFDGDGTGDLFVRTDKSYVVFGGPTPGVVTVGDPARTTAVTIAGAPASDAAPVGDFNGDGSDDLRVIPSGSIAADALVLGGPRVPALDARSVRSIQIGMIRSCTIVLFIYRCSAYPSAVNAVGDVNGDGRADLYFVDRSFISLGRPGTAAIPSTGPDANGIDVVAGANETPPDFAGGADFNGDGIADLSIGELSATGVQQLRVFPGKRRGPGGSLNPKTEPALVFTASTGFANAVPAGDLDGDGRADALAADASGLSVLTVPAAAPAIVPITRQPLVRGVATADLKSDGSVVLTAPDLTYIGDLDGDGQRDVAIASTGLDYCGLNTGALMFATHGVDHAAPELIAPGLVTPERGTSLTPTSFSAVPGSSGTRLRVVLTEPADVELTYRGADGTPRSTERRAALPAGVTETTWDGQGHGIDGRPGSYLLDVVPVDAAGNRGARVRLPFTVTGQGPAQKATLTITQRTEIAPGVPPPPAALDLGSIVAGTCPDAVNVNVEPGTTLAVGLGNAVATDRCRLEHESPYISTYDYPGSTLDVWPWRTTVSINGGPEVDISAIRAANVVPAFELRGGPNTVVFTDRYDGRGFAGRFQINDYGRWGTLGSGVQDVAKNELRLTTATANQRGGAISAMAIDAASVDVEFDAVMAGGQGSGNGLAVGFVDVSRGHSYPLLPGGANVGLGWTGWAGPAVGLVTVKGTLNPAENFVGLMTGAVGPSGYPVWLATADPGKTLAFSTSHVRLRSKDGTLTVWIDGRQVLQRAIILPRYAGLGFSAATGGASRAQAHTIRNLTVKTS